MVTRRAFPERKLPARDAARLGRTFAKRCFPTAPNRARQQANHPVGIMQATARGQPAKKKADRNLRFGWWSLLIFLLFGGALETMHGFKIGWYLDVGNEVRRLMFTLAHAHGTLLALVNIAAGLTARTVVRFDLRPSLSVASI